MNHQNPSRVNHSKSIDQIIYGKLRSIQNKKNKCLIKENKPRDPENEHLIAKTDAKKHLRPIKNTEKKKKGEEEIMDLMEWSPLGETAMLSIDNKDYKIAKS